MGKINAPIGIINESYQNNIESLWQKTGTSDSEASGGLILNVSSALDEANFVVYSNNNSLGTTTQNLPSGESIQKRSTRKWQFDEIGSLL